MPLATPPSVMSPPPLEMLLPTTEIWPTIPPVPAMNWTGIGLTLLIVALLTVMSRSALRVRLPGAAAVTAIVAVFTWIEPPPCRPRRRSTR